jgi:hypothetical protein
MAELNVRKKTTPIGMTYEATKSIYSYCYLASGVSLYGQGNLNLAIINRKALKQRLVMMVDFEKNQSYFTSQENET